MSEIPENQELENELAFLGLSQNPDDWLEIRITDLDGSVTKEKVLEFCEQLTSTYFGGEENANNHHFHLGIHQEKSLKKSEISQKIYDWFQVQLNSNGSKKGNASHSVKTVKNLPCYYAYCLKDGDYFASQNLTDITEIMFSHSYEKPLGYKNDLKKHSQQFQNDEITAKELWVKVGHLRAFYDLELNERKVYEYVKGQQVKKDPELWENSFNPDNLY